MRYRQLEHLARMPETSWHDMQILEGSGSNARTIPHTVGSTTESEMSYRATLSGNMTSKN